MVVKNTNLGGTDWADGDSLSHTDLNDTFDEAFEQYMLINKINTWYFGITD